jgi:hypothetical protein
MFRGSRSRFAPLRSPTGFAERSAPAGLAAIATTASHRYREGPNALGMRRVAAQRPVRSTERTASPQHAGDAQVGAYSIRPA